MADDIKQVLGIDATQALETLKQLDTAYQTFENRVGAVAKGLENFNTRAANTVTVLKEIKSAADAAAKSLSKVGGAQAKQAADPVVRSAGASKSPAKKNLTGVDAENAFNQLLGQPLTQSAKQAEQAASSFQASLQKVRAAAQTGLGSAGKDVEKFTVSWETLSRVVATQFIVRAMSQLRDVMREAVGDAIEFQKKIALITTIAGGTWFGEIADSVRSISDEFNLPLLETASGVYQALSNQVGDFGESLRFTEDAAKFAKATNSTLADSVDLLSGAMRSYGLTVEDTGKISGIFFTAIDKGRVTATELANAFGRVGPSAKAIGISLEELAAAAATISDKGLGTSETLTQFRGVVTALTKPTEEMTKKLQELGFPSSEAAIDVLGLSGTLDALAKATDGSAASLSKLFPNVRGVGGALSLTGENLKTFSENIKLAQINGEEFANSKFAEATATNAEKVTKEINKVKNALTVDFGQAVLGASNSFFQLSGGADGVITAIRVLTPTAITAAAAITAVSVAVGGMKLAMIAAAGPTGIVIGGLAAIAVAVPAALAAIDQARSKNALKGVGEIDIANEKELELFRKAGARRLDLAKQDDKKLVASAKNRIAEISAQYARDVENTKSLNAAVVANTQNSLDQIVGARQKYVQELAGAVADSQQAIRDSQGRISDIAEREDNRKFEFKSRQDSDPVKAFKLIQRSSDLARKAEEQLNTAFRTGNKELQQRALKSFDAANAASNEADAIGQRTGNRGLEFRAAQQLESTAKKQIEAETRINQLQQQRQQLLEAERQRQEKIVEAIKEQAKIVLDNTGEFDKNGNQFSEADQKDRATKRVNATKAIAGLTFSAKDAKIGDVLGMTQFLNTMNGDLKSRPIRLQFDIEQDIKQVRASMEKALQDIDTKLPFLKDLEEAVGRPLRGIPDAIRQAIVQVQDELSTIRAEDQQQQNLTLDFTNQQAGINQVAGNLSKIRSKTGEVSDALKPAANAVGTFTGELLQMAQTGEVSQARLVEIAQSMEKLDFGSKFGGLASQAQLVNELIIRLQKLGETQVKLQAVNPDAARQQALTETLNKLGTTTFDTKLSNAQVAITNTLTPIATIKTDAENTAIFAERTAAAYVLASTQTLPKAATAGTQLPATGGSAGAGGAFAVAQNGRHLNNPKYMAGGGFMPRGMDTIPVMARAGETIIDPDNSRKFFSQIQAIRAGKNPVYRSTGGSVTNVGDIAINVNGSESPQATGRAVAAKLRREFRKGTSRL
jgi:TP901 family phage tail tape measure protein